MGQTKGLRGWVYLLAALLPWLTEAAKPKPCASEIASRAASPPQPGAVVTRHPSSIPFLTILQYNLLNLERHVGKHEPRGRDYVPVEGRGPRLKDEHFRQQQGQIIDEVGADVCVFEEVEDKAALQGFNAQFMGNRFTSYLIEGNDGRGIDIGFAIKRDLPFKIEHRTYKERTWYDPESEEEVRLFSRDLPVLIFRLPGETKPFLILVGTHYKSKRDRDGDRESRKLRRAQVDGSVEIMRELRREFGEEIPLIFGGDTNGNVNREAEFANLKKALALEDVFDIVTPPLSAHERVTHTFHPNGGAAKADQLDVLMVSQSIRQCVKKAYVYRYKNADGQEKPLPRTYNDRKKNPSDHFPVVLTLDFPCLLEAARRVNGQSGRPSVAAH